MVDVAAKITSKIDGQENISFLSSLLRTRREEGLLEMGSGSGLSIDIFVNQQRRLTYDLESSFPRAL